MNTYSDLYPFQMTMVKILKYKPNCRFRDLKIDGITTDLQSFHVKQLINLGIVEKSEGGTYSLTNRGKEYANRMDDEIQKIEQQGKAGVLIRLTKIDGKTQKFLVYRRNKEPFFGCVGFHTGKIRQGELVWEAASRELEEETGLTADLYLVGVIHYLDYSDNGEFIRDQYFYTFSGYNAKGELRGLGDDGEENFWSDIEGLRKEVVYPGFWDTADGLEWFTIPSQPPQKAELVFFEKRRVIERY